MKLMELTSWHELMKQSAWTIDFWYGQGENLGIKSEDAKLKYAELCLREYENATKLRIVDEVLEKVTGRVDDLIQVLEK